MEATYCQARGTQEQGGRAMISTGTTTVLDVELPEGGDSTWLMTRQLGKKYGLHRATIDRRIQKHGKEYGVEAELRMYNGRITMFYDTEAVHKMMVETKANNYLYQYTY